MVQPAPEAEWLEVDGLGGFASGTVSGIRTRRYHALLLTATTPPSGRMVLVNGFDAWLETPDGELALSSQRYAPGVTAPDGASHVAEFQFRPWPHWIYRFGGTCEVSQEIIVQHGTSAVWICWTLLRCRFDKVRLAVRPFMSGRDFHAMHHENGAFDFTPATNGDCWVWRPYHGVSAITVKSGGTYTHEPLWYRNFLYTEERERGLDDVEDLAAPGVFRWDLSLKNGAEIALAAEGYERALGDPASTVCEREAKRRAAFSGPLQLAADAYVARRGKGCTIIAGYPWFGDWGRDTFIAMRGLCLAAWRLDTAREILMEWAGLVSEGMLPNRFPESGTTPEYNSVDASLWYIVAVQEYLHAAPPQTDDHDLYAAVESILTGYRNGTRFGIRMDDDGLLACGVPGVQLTWMDAKVGDWVVTPRIGKPVEIQALWINALTIGATFSDQWPALRDKAMASFGARFWNATAGGLFDVVDAGHQPGVNDPLVRPNQIFAVGGLPVSVLGAERALAVVETVERELLTPMGLRTLAPGSPGYVPNYEGDVRKRDAAYHQGTVWPWLMGPFVEAWLRVHGDDSAARKEARERFIAPLCRNLEVAGLGHISEIADAEPPHTPRGCPFQAWSLGELLRIEKLLS